MKKKGRREAFSWRDLFTNKAFDLIIVIAGVTIAFQLNSLKQSADQRALERFYLESLVNDLERDLQQYRENLNELTQHRKSVLSCLGKMEGRG